MIMLLAPFMFACTGSFDDTAASFNEADTDTDTDADTDTDTDTDADIELDCESFQGTPVSGAAAYFVGDFTISGKTVTGTEEWRLDANSTWQENGGNDCVVVWYVTGEQGAPTSTCGSCTYSLAIEASLDASLSTCPEGLVAGDEQFSTTYNVKISGESATFYFAGSGNELGVGTASGNAVGYETDPSCLYF